MDAIQLIAWLLQSGLKFGFGDIFRDSQHSSSQSRVFNNIIPEPGVIAYNRCAASSVPKTQNGKQILSCGEDFCHIIPELGEVTDSCVLTPVCEKRKPWQL